MFVHVYGSETLYEWVIDLPDNLDDATAMAEAIRRVKAGEVVGRPAATRHIAVIPMGPGGSEA